MEVRLTADLAGTWRPGYTGRQWDSTSTRAPADLRAMVAAIGPDAPHRPAAAKDVSMAGVVGTLGMLAEASGTGAVLDVAAVPRPVGATVADWLTCFPGFALLTADAPGAPAPSAGPADERGVRGAHGPGDRTGRGRPALARRRGHRGRRRGRHRTGQRPAQRRDPPVTVRTFAAAAAGFGRDLDESFATISSLLERARAAGADVLALPEAALGGYLSSLHERS